MKNLEIIDPTTGREFVPGHYTARPVVVDDTNYVQLGLIVRDDDGKVLKDVEVKVETTDSDQDQTIGGTGCVRKVYEGKICRTVHFYQYYYEFRTVEKHKIKFTAIQKSESIHLDAEEPE